MYIDKNKFNENLTLTQRFCANTQTKSETGIASNLRTFNPVINKKPLFEFIIQKEYFDEPTLVSKWNIDPFNNKEFFIQIFKKQLDNKKKIVSGFSSNYPNNFHGKILVSEYSNSVIDGGSEIESKGFVDSKDFPPIDTWFYITKYDNTDLLFSWIPEKYVEYAKQAEMVNCVDIFSWYENETFTNTLEPKRKSESILQRLISFLKN